MTALWLSSPLSQHKYRIQITVPARPAPPQGYPAVFMLDGDWSMNALAVTPQHPDWPVALVAVGYGPDPAASRVARAYDYTPALPGGKPDHDPRMPQWRSGGADIFLDFLETILMPALDATVRLDPTQRTLYGHSYGGLFVLHALYRRRDLFKRYVAASPSLWWRDQYLIKAADTLLGNEHHDETQLLLMVGEGEAWHPLPAGKDPADPTRAHGIPTLPMAQRLAKRLNGVSGLSTTLEILPRLNHADMLPRSASRAISFASTGLIHNET